MIFGIARVSGEDQATRLHAAGLSLARQVAPGRLIASGSQSTAPETAPSRRIQTSKISGENL